MPGPRGGAADRQRLKTRMADKNRGIEPTAVPRTLVDREALELRQPVEIEVAVVRAAERQPPQVREIVDRLDVAGVAADREELELGELRRKVRSDWNVSNERMPRAWISATSSAGSGRPNAAHRPPDSISSRWDRNAGSR